MFFCPGTSSWGISGLRHFPKDFLQPAILYRASQQGKYKKRHDGILWVHLNITRSHSGEDKKGCLCGGPASLHQCTWAGCSSLCVGMLTQLEIGSFTGYSTDDAVVSQHP